MKPLARSIAALIAIAPSLILLPQSASAGTIWDGGGADDNWGTGANWNDDLTPTVGPLVDLTFAGTTRLSPFNNYTAFDDFHSLIFDATAGSFSLTGSALDIFGKIENYSTNVQTVGFDLAVNAGQTGTGEFNPVNGDLSITSANVFTNGNTLHVYGTNGKTVTFGATTVISQTGHFNVEQASNVVFLGNNTYTGTTNVLAGSLTVGGGGTTGALGTGTVTGATGATLTYNRSDAVTLGQTLNIGGALVKNGAGALTISGAQTGITGTVAINAGRITMGANNSLGTAAVTLNGGTIERNAAAVTVANAIAIGASGGTILGRQVVDDYTTFSGQLTGSGALTVQGLLQISNNTNSHSGSIAISNASLTFLRLPVSEVLGNTSAVTMGGTNAHFRLDGGVTETIGSLAGSGTVFVSNVGNGLVGTLKIGGDNTSTAYTGQLNNNDGQLQIVKQGSGTFTLSPSSSTFQGLTISNGTVLAGSANYGTATITLGDAGTGANNVAFLTTSVGSSRNITVSASGSGTATIGSTTGAGAGNVSFGGLITLNRATTMTAASTDRTSWEGKITGNVGTLTFAGGQRTVLENLTNDFVGDVAVTGTNTVLQTGVGTGTEHIPNGSSIDIGTGAIVKLAGVAAAAETINALTGAGTIRRHEGLTGLATLTIGSAGGSGTFTGTLENGTSGLLALVKSGSGTQILNKVGGTGNGAAISSVAVNNGTLSLVHTVDSFDRGYFLTAPITINAGGTLDATLLWTIKSTTPMTVNGGTLNFSSPFSANVSDTNYMNNLTLQNGGTISGPGGFRAGNVAGPTLTMNSSGNLTNTISTNLFFIKNGGVTTYSMNVADGTAPVDLDITGNINENPSFLGMVLNKAGAGNLRLAGTNTFGGATTITAGTLTLGAGGATGSLTGPITNSATLAIDRSGTAAIANVISGAGILNHVGTGTTTLTGANTYTGATNVNSGTLITTPAQTGATTVTVADGATFGVKLNTLGTTLNVGTVTTGTTTGATLRFDNGALANPTAPMLNVTTFTPTAATTLRVIGSNLTAGTFTLLDYTGSIGGTGYAGLSLALPFRVGGSLVDNSGNTSVDVTISGAETAKWQGNTNGDWDIDPDGGNTAGTFNWKTSLLSTSTRYAQGATNTDSATFDDTATGTTTVNLTTTLTPLGTTVNNTTLNYTFGGAGKLSGTTGLTKQGNGKLTLVSPVAYDYTGGTTISGGTLQLGDGATAGAGAISGAITNNATLALNRPDDVTFTNVVTGTGAMLKLGAGATTITGANGYGGGTTVSEGRLRGTTSTAFGTGTIVIGDTAANASLYLGQRADITNAVTVSALGSGTVVIGADNTGSGADASTFAGTLTLNRPTTLSGEVAGDRLGIDGRITGNVGTLTVTGGARTTFQATTNDFTGDIVVTGAGTILQASVATAAETIPNGSSVTVNSGAILQLASLSGAETINALNGSGTVRTFPTAAFGSNLTVGSAGGSGSFSGTLVNGFAALSLTKTGAGTQTLGGVNTYTGPTIVSGGTLAITGSISGSATIDVQSTANLDVAGASGGFIVATGQTLKGNGNVLGATTVNGTLSPGASPGTLTFNNALTFGTASALTLEIGGTNPGEFDKVAGVTNLTLDGTFTVSLFGGFNPVPGNSFDVLDWSGAINATGFNVGTDLILPGLTLDYTWDTTAFTTTGILAVVPEPSAMVSLFAGLGILSTRRRTRGA